jgi:hypothetical protein
MLVEYVSYLECTNTLSNAGGRALRAMISKLSGIKNIGYSTYTKIYSTGVAPILDYGAEVWRYSSMKNICENVQNRAIRYYFGVHRYTDIHLH